MPVESLDIQNPEVLEKILAQTTEILVREYGASLVVFHEDHEADKTKGNRG
ncbi:MAG: hypothetical protein ACP5OP_05465 [Leptospirillia bacterium]